jgi:hypothetical protein
MLRVSFSVSWRLAVLALGGTLVWACKGGAVGVETCKQIENALCARAPACGINLSATTGTPRHSDSETDVQACQQFYAIECQHGLETSATPSSAQVQDCVNAITKQAEGCDGGTLINDTQDVALNGACSWLVPPTPVVVDAAVAATDGTVAADAGADVVSNDSGLVIISP